MKPVTFVGDSLQCLRDFPADVRHDAGYQFDKVQRGLQPDDFKPMPTIGKGVEEIRIWDDSGIYRVIYTAGRPTRSSCCTPSRRRRTYFATRHRDCEGSIRRSGEGSKMTKTKVYASVWDALADTPEQAANLRARAELMQQIAAIVKKNRWTQTEAAQRCGVTQPRMNDLLRGRVSRFSLDALVNIATAIGRRVHVALEPV